MSLFLPAFSHAETIALMCTADASRSNLPDGAAVIFHVDLDGRTVGYVDENGRVAWLAPATITPGSILWNAYSMKWFPRDQFPTGPRNWDAAYGNPGPIRDLSQGALDPGASLQGRIDRTTGAIYGSALYYPSPGRYRVVGSLYGKCRLVETTKF
jgi:hypothetical protein